jgi:phosphate transport system substrate-binding protein
MIKRLIILICFIPLTGPAAQARDQIRIVGSQEVLPFIETIAQTFSTKSINPAPALEVTGSGNGFRLLCKGIGFEHPDINVTSRPMTSAEYNICEKNGVNEITEILIGHDAIVIANSSEADQFDFTPAQIFTALGASVEKDGRIKKNTFKNWKEIDPTLPDKTIRVIGPPVTSGTYDDFMRLIMEKGCSEFPRIVAQSLTDSYTTCHSIRTDDAFTQGLRIETALLDWLQSNSEGFAITRYSFLMQNQDLIAGSRIDGISPSAENITDGSYSLRRPMYVYVKTKHVAAVKGLQNFLYELTNDRTIGPDGYLVTETNNGFAPLTNQGRNHARDMAISLAPIDR